VTLVVLLQLAGFAFFFVGENSIDRLVDEEGWVDERVLDDAELVRHGDVVCSTSREELFCVEAASGDVVLSEQLGGVATAPALVDDTLVVAVAGGPTGSDVRGYSLEGEQLWELADLQGLEVDPTAALRHQLSAVGEIVAVPLGGMALTGNGVVGIDARSGAEVWRAFDGAGSVGPGGGAMGPFGDVLSDGSRFYAEMLTDMGVPAVVALDPASGTELWRYELDTPPADPVLLRSVAPVTGGSAVALAFSGQPAQFVVVDAATGVPRWDVPIEGDQVGVTHLDGVTVVVDAGSMRAFDDDGTELWSEPAPGGGNSPDDLESQTVPEMVVESDTIYALDIDVHTVDISDGTTRQVHTRSFSTDVAVAAGHLVVAGRELQGIPLEAGDRPG
jgi:outer membrane protein assembly factor BamB